MDNKNNNIEYYKSQISDDEVIQALIKESKEREGELPKQKTRVRPNINFFQRTVANLVSSNKRIRTQDNGISKYEDRECSCNTSPRTPTRKASFSNIRKVNSEEDQSDASVEEITTKVKSGGGRDTSKTKENMKNYIEKKRKRISRLKQQQERLRKLKTLSEDKVARESCEDKSTDFSEKVLRTGKPVRRSSDSSESIVSLSSTDSRHSNDNVITLLDSEPECSDKEDIEILDLCADEDTPENPT